MNALVKFSFERWEKSQQADLVIEIIDANGDVRTRVRPVTTTWFHYQDSEWSEMLFLEAIVDCECCHFTVLYCPASKSWQYCCTDLEEQFDVYIETK